MINIQLVSIAFRKLQEKLPLIWYIFEHQKTKRKKNFNPNRRDLPRLENLYDQFNKIKSEMTKVKLKEKQHYGICISFDGFEEK